MESGELQEVITNLQKSLEIHFPGEEAEISIEESQIPPGIRIILTVGEYQTKIFLDEYFLSKNPAEAIYKNFVILKREINDKKLSKSITIDPGEYL
jgi:hypothetical protein